MISRLTIFLLIFASSGAHAGSDSGDVFGFAEKLQKLIVAKDLAGLQHLTGSESRIRTLEEISQISHSQRAEGQNSTADLITRADLIHIQAGKRASTGVAGIIYFIVKPEQSRRRIWLVDYAACAFYTDHGEFRLRNGFCFLGTDGAPELDSENGKQLMPKE